MSISPNIASDLCVVSVCVYVDGCVYMYIYGEREKERENMNKREGKNRDRRTINV